MDDNRGYPYLRNTQIFVTKKNESKHRIPQRFRIRRNQATSGATKLSLTSARAPLATLLPNVQSRLPEKESKGSHFRRVTEGWPHIIPHQLGHQQTL